MARHLSGGADRPSTRCGFARSSSARGSQRSVALRFSQSLVYATSNRLCHERCWQQLVAAGQKSHSKLQSAARRSAPLSCYQCGRGLTLRRVPGVRRIDAPAEPQPPPGPGLPVLHGHGEAHARQRRRLRRPAAAIQSGPRESDAAAPARPSDASRYAACPVCSSPSS